VLFCLESNAKLAISVLSFVNEILVIYFMNSISFGPGNDMVKCSWYSFQGTVNSFMFLSGWMLQA